MRLSLPRATLLHGEFGLAVRFARSVPFVCTFGSARTFVFDWSLLIASALFNLPRQDKPGLA
jgi:hypothetical protein